MPGSGVRAEEAQLAGIDRRLEELGFFTGPGTAIVFFAALALGICLAAAFQAAGLERYERHPGQHGGLARGLRQLPRPHGRRARSVEPLSAQVGRRHG